MNQPFKFRIILACTLFFLIFTAKPVNAGNDSIFVITPHFQQGEILKYEISAKNSASFTHEEIIARVTEKIKKIKKKYIEIEWKYDTVYQISSGSEDIRHDRKKNPFCLMSGKTIRYRTDRNGKLTEILNFPELKKELKPKFDSLLPAFFSSFSPHYFEMLLLNNLVAIHQLYGVNLKSNDTTQMEVTPTLKPDIVLESKPFRIYWKSKTPSNPVKDNPVYSLEGSSSIIGIIITYTYTFKSPSNLLESFDIEMKSKFSGMVQSYEQSIKLVP